jgi:hypothetical protein
MAVPDEFNRRILIDKAEIVLAYTGLVDDYDSSGRTPLTMALCHGKCQCAKALFNYKHADPYFPDRAAECTPMHHAGVFCWIFRNRVQIVGSILRLVCPYVVDPRFLSIEDNEGKTPEDYFKENRTVYRQLLVLSEQYQAMQRFLAEGQEAMGREDEKKEDAVAPDYVKAAESFRQAANIKYRFFILKEEKDFIKKEYSKEALLIYRDALRAYQRIDWTTVTEDFRENCFTMLQQIIDISRLLNGEVADDFRELYDAVAIVVFPDRFNEELHLADIVLELPEREAPARPRWSARLLDWIRGTPTTIRYAKLKTEDSDEEITPSVKVSHLDALGLRHRR